MPRPIGKVFQPEVAAEAIYWAACHKRRELWVGFPAAKAIVGTHVVPGLIDRVLAAQGYEGQQSQAPAPAAEPPAATQSAQPADDQPLNNNQLQQQLNQFLVDNGALVRINDAGRDHGQIRAFNNPAYDVAKARCGVRLGEERADCLRAAREDRHKSFADARLAST